MGFARKASGDVQLCIEMHTGATAYIRLDIVATVRDYVPYVGHVVNAISRPRLDGSRADS